MIAEATDDPALSSEALEDILEERMKGSFIEIADHPAFSKGTPARVNERFPKQSLEDTLEERMKGPFIPLPDDWIEQTLAKARQHIVKARAAVAND